MDSLDADAFEDVMLDCYKNAFVSMNSMSSLSFILFYFKDRYYPGGSRPKPVFRQIQHTNYIEVHCC